jgi:hypothetical protein
VRPGACEPVDPLGPVGDTRAGRGPLARRRVLLRALLDLVPGFWPQRYLRQDWCPIPIPSCSQVDPHPSRTRVVRQRESPGPVFASNCESDPGSSELDCSGPSRGDGRNVAFAGPSGLLAPDSIPRRRFDRPHPADPARADGAHQPAASTRAATARSARGYPSRPSQLRAASVTGRIPAVRVVDVRFPAV